MSSKKFRFVNTPIRGLIIVETKIFGDERGFFMETYNMAEFYEGGIAVSFVQDNQSHSRKFVLRGLHFQKNHPQGKLVRVVKGKVFDVAVDLRRGSETFGKWFGVELSEQNHRQFYIPPGFAHGFLALEESDFVYKCTDFYHPEDEYGIIWNDPEIGIRWPISNPEELIISDKDKKHPTLREFLVNVE